MGAWHDGCDSAAMHLASVALRRSTGIVPTTSGRMLTVMGAVCLEGRTAEEIEVVMHEAARDVSVVPSQARRLPVTPARRWSMRAGVVGRPRMQTVHRHPQRQVHASPDRAWFAISADRGERTDVETGPAPAGDSSSGGVS